jgi:hypothetical protein
MSGPVCALSASNMQFGCSIEPCSCCSTVATRMASLTPPLHFLAPGLGDIARKHIKDPTLLRFIDLECYIWSTVSADMTPMINAGMVSATVQGALQ